MYEDMVSCEDHLRKFLLHNIYPTRFDQVFIAITGYTSTPTPGLNRINSFFTRSVELQVIFDEKVKKTFFYCRLPHFMFIGSITGLRKSDYENSCINPIGGQLTPSQMRITDRYMLTFIFSRMKEYSTFEIPEHQYQKITQRIMEQLNDFEKTRAYQALMLDFLRENKQ